MRIRVSSSGILASNGLVGVAANRKERGQKYCEDRSQEISTESVLKDKPRDVYCQGLGSTIHEPEPPFNNLYPKQGYEATKIMLGTSWSGTALGFVRTARIRRSSFLCCVKSAKTLASGRWIWQRPYGYHSLL